jgi:hypothetical protein
VGATMTALRTLQRTQRPAFTWAWLALVLVGIALLPILAAIAWPTGRTV